MIVHISLLNAGWKVHVFDRDFFCSHHVDLFEKCSTLQIEIAMLHALTITVSAPDLPYPNNIPQ